MLIRDPHLRPNCEQVLGNKCIILYLSKRLATMGKAHVSNLGLSASVIKPKEEVLTTEERVIEDKPVEEREAPAKIHYDAKENLAKENSTCMYSLIGICERTPEKYELPKRELSKNKDNPYDLNRPEMFQRKVSLHDMTKPSRHQAVKKFVSKQDVDIFSLKRYENFLNGSDKKLYEIPELKKEELSIEVKQAEATPPFTGKSKWNRHNGRKMLPLQWRNICGRVCQWEILRKRCVLTTIYRIVLLC
eukprot:TRINITY_DN1052_c0_g4_i1.p1 TRINITY_DN1052_c0_g4~~TRINITY_DN1052_c0_g4_i1.p1  ORF type:complete len:247 (-),score=38.37 TRINITY_DN1052_c0_g4_i1:1162-1902(-)